MISTSKGPKTREFGSEDQEKRGRQCRSEKKEETKGALYRSSQDKTNFHHPLVLSYIFQTSFTSTYGRSSALSFAAFLSLSSASQNPP